LDERKEVEMMFNRCVCVRTALKVLVLLLIISAFVLSSSGSLAGPLNARIKIVPSIWYNSWANVVSRGNEKGDVLCYIGNLSGGHMVSEISVNSILLNGKVRISKNSDMLLASFPGFIGPVLRVGFNKREALLSLGFTNPGPARIYPIYRVEVEGWIPNGQCPFYGFASVIVRGLQSPVPFGVTHKSGYSTPDAFGLSQNYPNPFNPETEISYVLPKACQIDLSVYNLLGQKVRMLVHEFQSAGLKNVKWDGKDEYGIGVASGVYFYKIKAGEFTQSKKMVMLR
jgi:hypothetical protein